MSEAFISIYNATDAGLELPGLDATETQDAVKAVSLVPGFNKVPADLVESLKSYTVKDRFGKEWQPHGQLLERHMAAGRIRLSTDAKDLNRPDGPEPPKDLSKIDFATAKDLIRDQKGAYGLKILKQWRAAAATPAGKGGFAGHVASELIALLDERIERLER